MITDARHALLTPLLHLYVRWKLKTAFRGVWASGALPGPGEPLILYANHHGFWDGFLAHALVHRAGRAGYALMEEQNLARYRFLTRLGAMSIRPTDPRSVLTTLRHATRVLERPDATLLLFPQGKLVAPAAPLRFERGIEVLARMAKARAVPVGLRYAFFEHEYPDALLAVGEPHPVRSVADCEARLTHLLKGLDALEAPTSLDPLLAGRRSVAERWGRPRSFSRRTP
jgi:1-acyl-sn-glycerol-3-phosphate acyltransferase